jgi:hypothetical protein
MRIFLEMDTKPSFAFKTSPSPEVGLGVLPITMLIKNIWQRRRKEIQIATLPVGEKD